MKSIMENWNKFLVENSKDSKQITKIILFDEDDKVLFLKRAENIEKFAGKWDLPGGHVHEGEDILDGLEREVKEETGLKIGKVKKIKTVKNMHYFKASLPLGDIKLSDEHTEHTVRNVKNIKNPNKFEKIAQEALKND